MSRSANVTTAFGGENRIFRFGIGEHRRLQEAVNVGVSHIVQSLHHVATALSKGLTVQQVLDVNMMGDIRVDQVREVLFQGLIGGGMSPNDAGSLCRDWCLNRPLMESVITAHQVGMAALIGVEEERALGEPQGGAAGGLSPRASSASAKTASTRSVRPAASRRGKSTK